MVYYKCLTLDNKSWYDRKTEWVPGKWMPEIENKSGKLECGTGYHLGLTIEDAVRYGSFPCLVWSAVGRGVYGKGRDKKRYRTAKIIGDVTPEYIKRASDFIESISGIKWFSGRGKRLKKWKSYKTRAAAWDAARDAARATAWDAAWEAARAAARAAAWDAARDAARAIAWEAARAARAAAGDAAGDAALMVESLICPVDSVEKKHMAHIKDRWEVWRRGYGLLCDIDGVLYVYDKP